MQPLHTKNAASPHKKTQPLRKKNQATFPHTKNHAKQVTEPLNISNISNVSNILNITNITNTIYIKPIICKNKN